MFKVAGLLCYESPRMKGIIDSTCLKILELKLEIINRSRQKDDCFVGAVVVVVVVVPNSPGCF